MHLKMSKAIMLALLIFAGNLAGCAPKEAVLSYAPSINSGMTDAARETLTTLLNKGKINVRRRVEDAGLDPNSVLIVRSSTADQERLEIMLSDRGEPFTLRFADLSGKDLSVKREGWIYTITLPDIRFSSPAIDGSSSIKLFADALLSVQQEIKSKKKSECEELDAEVAAFEKTVQSLQPLPEKPTISEEQRRYIVQANALSQQKEYSKAIEIYKKAIEIDALSYPSAYFNSALLAAQTGNYCNAIANMKKYIILAPDAKDARGAQDKIYEWELHLQK